MRQFFKFLFASCLGTALALVLLCFIGIGMIGSLSTSMESENKVAIKPNAVLKLDFSKPIPERTNNVEMDPFDFEQKDVLGVSDMVKAIRAAKNDNDIKGIYLNAMFMNSGKASASTIREALLDFKTSGKFIYAYSSIYTQSAYYMASVADSIFVNPMGAIEFKGYGYSLPFFKNMLDKLDVQMRIFYAGKFKSATEPYRLDKMSDENRLQIRAFLNDMNDILMRDVAKSRNLPEADVRRIANNYEGRTPQKAVDVRLADRVVYEDEAFDALRNRIGLSKSEKVQLVSVEDYFSTRGRNTDFSVNDKIAVVYLEGSINDGNEGEAGQILDGKVVKDLRKIRDDKSIKSVVLRVNSPGGSVLASENILREINLIKASGRPIVVSMGDLAASGGYYISCTADSIFAEPNTITGSIGVFGMIPILQKTLKENLGVTFDTVKTGRFSTFGSVMMDFSPEESEMIQSNVERIYDEFLTRVANGRKMPKEKVHEIAQGRVWTGIAAKQNGLVDDIGGIDRALAAAAKLANLEKYRISEYPRTSKGIEQFIEKYTKKGDGNDVKSALIQQELGDMYPFYQYVRDIHRAKGIQAKLPFELYQF